MPLNPNNELDRGRLITAVAHHYGVLSPFREQRTKLIEDYAGSFYGEQTEPRKRKQLVNLMLQTAQAYTLAMTANNPRINATTKYRELRGFALHFKEAINNLIVEIHLQETLAAVMLDAFFGPGILKVCLGDSAEVQIENDVWMDPGRPYVGRISPDDWCHDTQATDFRRCSFMVDRYRVPYEKLLDKNLYDQKVVAMLPKGASKYAGRSDTLADEIALGRAVDKDELVPMLDICDVFLREEGKVCTFAMNRDFTLRNLPPLAVMDWVGPETGPYKMLNLGPVPDNIMPTSPAANLYHLAQLLNSMMRKLDASARHQKDVLLVQVGNEDDGKKVRDAEHMGIVPVINPQAFTTVSFNGPNAVMTNFSMAVQNMYDRMAGNLKLMAGLGQQYDTATQEMAARGDVDAKEGALMLKVLRLTEEVARDLGSLMFEDQAMTLESSVVVPGMEKYGRIRSDWTPQYRRGRFFDYNLRVEPTSMSYQPPQQRAAKLRAQANDPMLAMMIQQGMVQFDVGEYMATLAEYEDMPEYLNIWTAQTMPGRLPQPQANGGMPTLGAIGKPNGKYERTNVSTGPTGDGLNAVLGQNMQGAAGNSGVAVG